jgi:Uma2 family endonuclease
MAILIETPAEANIVNVHFYSQQAYLERERKLPTGEKYEYINGKIIEMGGATEKHNTIFANLFGELYISLKSKPYRLYASDMRVHNPITESYFYPDVTVVRGAPLLKDQAFDNLLNPCLIIEILSPGTEEYDRVDKFTAYQSILTLEEYMLVSTEKRQVEYFRKETANQWQKIVFTKADDRVVLFKGETSIQLSDIYININL